MMALSSNLTVPNLSRTAYRALCSHLDSGHIERRSSSKALSRTLPNVNVASSGAFANMEEFAKYTEREVFEARWSWWNRMRTTIMGAVSVYLLSLTLRV
jgi:hypothetical protein